MANENSPVIFSITREEEIRYYRNDEMNLNDLIKHYSECERPFIELGEATQSQRIGTMDFVELEQTLGTTTIDIVPDENRVTVYKNKGNDVYENELGDGFEEYKLSELLAQVNNVQDKETDSKAHYMSVPVIFGITYDQGHKLFRNDNLDLNDIMNIYINSKSPYDEFEKYGNSFDLDKSFRIKDNLDLFENALVVKLDMDSNEIDIKQNKNGKVVHIEKPLSEYVHQYTAEKSQFKINNDYYRSLPKDVRYIEVVPVKHVQEIMKQLTDKGIEFSAVSRQNEKAAITVHSDHKDELHKTAQSIATEKFKKKQPEIAQTGKKETINPDFYKKLAPTDRHIQRITKADTDKVLSALESKGIEFSAVKSDKLTAITVHKNNKAAIGQALLESNKAAAKEFINSDYYKSLPADQRLYSQTNDLKAAKDIMKSLDSADVKYSAVIDNERSTARITIAKQDIQEAKKSGALFSRQSQRAFTSKAQAQNNERAAVKTAEHKKDDHSL